MIPSLALMAQLMTAPSLSIIPPIITPSHLTAPGAMGTHPTPTLQMRQPGSSYSLECKQLEHPDQRRTCFESGVILSQYQDELSTPESMVLAALTNETTFRQTEFVVFHPGPFESRRSGSKAHLKKRRKPYSTGVLPLAPANSPETIALVDALEVIRAQQEDRVAREREARNQIVLAQWEDLRKAVTTSIAIASTIQLIARSSGPSSWWRVQGMILLALFAMFSVALARIRDDEAGPGCRAAVAFTLLVGDSDFWNVALDQRHDAACEVLAARAAGQAWRVPVIHARTFGLIAWSAAAYGASSLLDRLRKLVGDHDEG